jgi:hypothetical protein
MSWVRILVALALVCQPASGSAFMASSPEAGVGDIHEGTGDGGYILTDAVENLVTMFPGSTVRSPWV